LRLRIFEGLLWTSSGTVVQLCLQLLVIAVLSRLLTPAQFGIAGAAIASISIFIEVIAFLGIGFALIQRPEPVDSYVRTAFTVVLVLGLAMGCITYLLADHLSHIFNISELAPYLRALSVVFPLQGAGVVAEALLCRMMHFRAIAATNVISYSIGAVVSIGLGSKGWGSWAIVIAFIATALIRVLTLLIAQPHPKLFQFKVKIVADLVRFGAGLTLTRVFAVLALQGDNVIVARFLGADALGLYGRAYQLMALPSALYQSIVDRVVFSALSRVQRDPILFGSVYRQTSAVTALIVVPFSAECYVLAPEIIRVMLGTGWEGAVVPFQVLSLGMFFRTIQKLAASVARSKGAVYRLASCQALYGALIVIGATVGCRFGLQGVASGVLLATMFGSLPMVQLSNRLTATTWSKLLGSYWRSGVLGCVAWFFAVISAYFLRIHDVTPPAVLFCSTIFSTAMCLLTLWVVPPLRGKEVQLLVDNIRLMSSLHNVRRGS
jgi:O-antigen/teichoic acid export membrane protein